MTHPTQRLDNAVHQRTRLGILTVLAGTKRVKFVFLRNVLDLTDGNLSRNLTVLDNAGNITVEKSPTGAGPERGSPSLPPVARLSQKRSAPYARSSGPSSRRPRPPAERIGPSLRSPETGAARVRRSENAG